MIRSIGMGIVGVVFGVFIGVGIGMLLEYLLLAKLDLLKEE